MSLRFHCSGQTLGTKVDDLLSSKALRNNRRNTCNDSNPEVFSSANKEKALSPREETGFLTCVKLICQPTLPFFGWMFTFCICHCKLDSTGCPNEFGTKIHIWRKFPNEWLTMSENVDRFVVQIK